MKNLIEKLKQQYQEINRLLESEDKKSILDRRHNQFRKREDQELITGAVIVVLIIVILLSFTYYFLIFAPEQDKISNLRQEKINQVHTLLPGDNVDSLAIISQIEALNTEEELENFDVEKMAHPLLKEKLIQDVDNNKDQFNRVELVTGNTSDILNKENAVKMINSSNTTALAIMSVRQVDSVIIPLSITRKQAASGLIHVGDTVDVYSTKSSSNENHLENPEENTTPDNYNTTQSSKISGGSKVVSILRSKDSGSIDKNIELSESPKSRNLSQSSLLDVQEVMESKAAGTYDEKQIKVLIDKYATRLSDYERTSQLGDLDVEYIVMIEASRSSVDDLIENMDNLILTIPTYEAPSWVKL